MSKRSTIAMTPMPEFGYDPIPLILSGEKVHTLRKQRCHGQKEVCVKGKRTGIVLEFHSHVEMTIDEFLTQDFARADGFHNTYVTRAWENLMLFLEHFYGKVPETMWRNHFVIVQQPEEEKE